MVGRMAEIGVILSGIGGVGKDLTRLLSARPGYKLAAAYTRNPELAGRDLGEHAGISSLGVEIVTDRAGALAQPADLLVVATTSFLQDVAEDVRAGIHGGLNVITTAEEAAFPWIIDAQLADELNHLAEAHRVSVIGLGLNPGFVFDALLLTASAVAWDVESIRIRRVVDVSRFSAAVLRRIGIGHTEEEFEAGVAAGSITGHIGFPQTFSLAARCLGRGLDRVEKHLEPFIAKKRIESDNLSVETGETGGFLQRVVGFVDEVSWFEAEFIAHLHLPAVEMNAQDSISIEGYNPIHLTIDPGCNPQLGTVAMLANCIPRVVEAKPDFITVADLAIPFARETLPGIRFL